MSGSADPVPQLAVRAVRPFDLALLARLHAGAFDPEWGSDEIASLLAMPGAFGLLALAAGAPVGFLIARVAAGEAEILSLGVAPPARRRGVGRMLLDAALAAAAAEGAERMFLEVAEDNAAARALYAAAAFRAVGRRPAYYRRRGAANAPAVVLERALQALPETPA